MWPVLYVLMGISLFLILNDGLPLNQKILPIAAFALQLALNFMWSPVFFRWRMLWPAFALVLALDLAAIITMALFYREHKVAGLLLLPHILWLLFATYLNAGCAILN